MRTRPSQLSSRHEHSAHRTAWNTLRGNLAPWPLVIHAMRVWRRKDCEHSRRRRMHVLVQTVGDARGGAGDQKRAPNVGCLIGRRAATAVVTKLRSTTELREFNGEKLCADTRSAVDPKSILRKQCGECPIA